MSTITDPVPRDPLVAAIQQTRNLTTGLAVMLTVIAIALALYPVLDRSRALPVEIGLIAMATFIVALAWRLLRRGNQLRTHDVVALVERRPHEMAWYSLAEQEMPLGRTRVFIRVGKTDGGIPTLVLITRDPAGLRDHIAARAPHAERRAVVALAVVALAG